VPSDADAVAGAAGTLLGAVAAVPRIEQRVHALAIANRKAGQTRLPAVTVDASDEAAVRSLANRPAASAVLGVGLEVDARVSALLESVTALENALAVLAQRHRVRWSRAHGSACRAILGIVFDVDARAAAAGSVGCATVARRRGRWRPWRARGRRGRGRGGRRRGRRRGRRARRRWGRTRGRRRGGRRCGRRRGGRRCGRRRRGRSAGRCRRSRGRGRARPPSARGRLSHGIITRPDW
jgi:hypothetical protein